MGPIPQILWGTNFENVLTLGAPLDNLITGRKPRDGSERVVAPSGVADAWITGSDYFMETDLRWVPRQPQTVPFPADPFDGPSGVQAFLDYARAANTFRLVPDAAAPSFFADGCYLDDPWDSYGSLENDGTRRLAVKIRNPSVDLGMASRGVMFDYVPGSSLTDPLVATFTRNSSGFRTSSPRTMVLEAVNVLRDRHYNTGGIRNTLLELARSTVGWDRSEELDHANWTKLGSNTVGVNAGGGGDGAGGGDTLIESALNESHAFQRNTPALTDNTLQSVAVVAGFFGSRTWFRIKTFNKANVQISTWFNIASGTIGTIGGGHTNVRMELVGTPGAQAYRCSLTFDSGTGATTPLVQFHMATADAGGDYAGDGTSRMLFWGMQFDVDRPFISSYLKDGAARGLDNLDFPFNYKPQAMFMLCDWQDYGLALGADGNAFAVEIGNAFQDGRFIIDSGATDLTVFHQASGGSVSQNVAGAPVLGDRVQVLAILNANGSVQLKRTINLGAETASGTSGSLLMRQAGWNPAKIQFYGGTTLGHGIIRCKVGALNFAGVTRDTIAKALAA